MKNFAIVLTLLFFVGPIVAEEPAREGVPNPGTPVYVAKRVMAPASLPVTPKVTAPTQDKPKSMAMKAPALVRVPEASADGSWGPVNYTYDGIGNITGIGNNYYVYDGVSRLVKASTNSVVQTFSYDRFGNITTITATNDSPLTLTVEPTSNRLQSVTKQSQTYAMTYDQLGDLTFDGVTSYTYDSLGTVTSAHLDKYLYDADEERVATLGIDGVNRYTLRGLDQKVLREVTDDAPHNKRWNWSKDYVYRKDSLLAEVLPSNGSEERRHYHLDHLGSPRMITDESTTPLRLGYHDFYPFGSDADSTPDGERMRFTGHERDLNNVNVTTLDYMHARYYAASWGRFLSIDPKLDDHVIESPQLWNRYSYAANDPIRFADLDGRGLWDKASGAANAFGSNHFFGFGRVDGNSDFREGQHFGDFATAATGLVEVGVGCSGEAVGFLLDATGVGALVGVPINVASAALIVDGGAAAIRGAGHLMAASNIFSGGKSSPQSVPQRAHDVANYANANGGSSRPGYVSKSYANDGRNGTQVLPKTDANGNPITYREYDVHPYQPGVNRGQERVVMGSDGSAYYTDVHYDNFIRFQ